MTNRMKRRTLYDPFNPPGATRIQVFTPAVTVPPRTIGTPAPVPPAAPSPAAPGAEPPAAVANAAAASGLPVAYAVAEDQVARASIPAGQVPDKIELALHPPGAKPQSTFTLG